MAWDEYTAHFHNSVIQQNILNAKEEEYQEGFVRDLFVNVLGYTLKPQPDFNFVLEQKSTIDSTKSDGAILSESGAIIAVIELKDTKTTDLSKVEKQAFGYKHQHKDCRYVITSNFQHLRFYINDAIDFETFDLFRLSKESFALLYCCLHQGAILDDVPLKMKQQSIAEEENITKKLYADYSRFRKQLFGNITTLNPQYNKLELFKKTQKLMDRFLFLLFAEDRLLLPPNSVRDILKNWDELSRMDEYRPLYDRFRKFFGWLNTGYGQGANEIYPYNGGLFAPDEILDTIRIDDNLLYDSCKALSNYDFESDVDVNILGHIFEHSLSEIEKIEQELTADPDLVKEPEAKYNTKRKKDGVYYTPRYITKYIVENTVGALCTKKKEELQIDDVDYSNEKKKAEKERLLQKLDNYKEWLLQLTICDPACGSGAFLNQALEFLIKEHYSTDQLKARLFGAAFHGSEVETSILEHNLYGVDINEEAVEIAKLSLWLRTAQKGRKLNNLSQHIRCGNSLIDDPAVAGDKAFNWRHEFPEVFAKGGFDVVIGNPPYVRADVLGSIKGYLQKSYITYQPSADLFTFFYEKAFHVLKSDGFFGFISNTFNKTTAAIELRRWLKEETNILTYVDFTEVQIFEGATTYPIIIIANKILNDSSFEYIKIKEDNLADIEIYYPTLVEQTDLINENWIFNDNSFTRIINKLNRFPKVTQKYNKTYYGIKTALNEAFLIPMNSILHKDVIKPIYEGRELKKWNNPEPSQDLILFKSKWTSTVFGKLNETEAFDHLQKMYPDIAKHLLGYEDKAKKRYDKGEFWWELRNCAYYHLFEQPKIIFPNLQKDNKFSLDTLGVFINAPSVMISLSHLNNPVQEGKYLLSLLNSKVVWFFLKSICVVRSGGYIEVKPQYFEQIPIPSIPEAYQTPFIEKTDAIINEVKELQGRIERLLNLLKSKYEHLANSRNLQSWPSLSSKEFLGELGKQKIKLTLAEQSEWMQYFEAEKAKANAIQDLINQTDKEIDAMVYELYGLTEEEVRIVEEG